MPRDAKLGLWIGIILVAVAAWFFRPGQPKPYPSASRAIPDATQPVFLPDAAN